MFLFSSPFWANVSLFFFLFGDFLFWSENEKQNTVRKLKNSDAQIGQLVCSFTQLTSRMKIIKMQQKFDSKAPYSSFRSIHHCLEKCKALSKLPFDSLSDSPQHNFCDVSCLITKQSAVCTHIYVHACTRTITYCCTSLKDEMPASLPKHLLFFCLSEASEDS